VVVIDNTVLTVAIPSLMHDLDADMSEVQWIIDAYVVVFAGLLLTAGALSDRYGRRLCLVLGLLVFGAASLGAAYAASTTQLIAARTVMGVGGALLMPGTLSILSTVFGDAERKKAIAIWSSVLMMGALGAPLLGGVLLDHFWWGSVFVINVPVAVVSMLAALWVIPESRGPAARPDLWGAGLSTVGMVALIWAIISAQRDGWWSGNTYGALLVAAGGLTGFAVRQRTAREPMLPLELFRDRAFTGASLSLVLMAFSSGGLLLALTQMLQLVLGYSPLRAGVALIPLLASAIVFNGVGVLLRNRWGARSAIVTGLVLLAAGFGLLARLEPGDGYPQLVFALVVAGAGSGTAGPPAYNTLLSALPTERAGVGSAVNDTFSQLGQALSVAVLGTVLTTFYAGSLPDQVTGSARSSLAAALESAGPVLARVARGAFVDGLASMSLVSALGMGVAALAAFVALRPSTPCPEQPARGPHRRTVR